MVAVSLACAFLAFGYIYSLNLDPAGPLTRLADELGYAFEPLVDSGPGTEVSTPLLTGRSLIDARGAVDALDLELVVDPVNDDRAEPSRVLGQEPAAGVLLMPGESVLVRVASGSESTVLGSLIGQNVETAQSQLVEAGYVAETVPIHHPDLPAGVVSEQFPEPGTEIEPGARVTLTYNAGLRLQAVPDLTGLDLELALRRAAAFGFEAVADGESHRSGLPPGIVLEQSPAPGTVLPVGEQLQLVANRLPIVEVPDLVDLPLERARVIGRATGIAIERIISPEPLPDRELVVRAQSVPAGRRVSLGTSVQLVVGYRAEG
jgi:serine/threonine-protein kinase